MKESIRGHNLFSEHTYGARTFLTETESCSGGSWWLYLSGKNDILMTILLKPRFYAIVIVSRSWWDSFRMLIWGLHSGPLTIPVWFYKDPTQILDKFPKVSYHVWKLIHLWSRTDSTDKAEKCLRSLGQSMFFQNWLFLREMSILYKNLDFYH